MKIGSAMHRCSYEHKEYPKDNKEKRKKGCINGNYDGTMNMVSGIIQLKVDVTYLNYRSDKTDINLRFQ
jgi:uncharacterized protein with FMN-binding domain